VAADPGPQRAVLLDLLRAPGTTVLVAEVDGEVAGVAVMAIRPRLNWVTPEAWLSDLYVSERRRRRGVARALVGECLTRARAAGCHVLRLEAGHGREEAHHLYESLGFRNAGRDYQLNLGST
jgi:GNAT superfamily N-acetyltransferase